jgi:hypothetical protein
MADPYKRYCHPMVPAAHPSQLILNHADRLTRGRNPSQKNRGQGGHRTVGGGHRKRRPLVKENAASGSGGSGGRRDGRPGFLPAAHAALENGGWAMACGRAAAHARAPQSPLHRHSPQTLTLKIQNPHCTLPR